MTILKSFISAMQLTHISMPVGDTKAEALLHGHSYTAHAVGCHAAIACMQSYCDKTLNQNFRGLEVRASMLARDRIRASAYSPDVQRAKSDRMFAHT